jgi:hypothetical protein
VELNASDKPVPREINALLSDGRLILRETQRAVTPFGGLAVFLSFLHRIGYVEAVRKHMPIRWLSPNQIDPTDTFTAFLLSVLIGARRFAHASLVRGDQLLHALAGITRFPTDDTIRNLFRKFSMGHVQRLFAPLAEWQMERLPPREAGYTLDLDSTVFERYGHQEGSLKGHNPRKHGRPSHHPLLAVLGEAHFLLHGWLRSGNCGTSRGGEEFLQEALALWGQRQTIRLVRADSGFFDDQLLSFLEQRRLPYIIVARLTKWVKRAAQRVDNWIALDENFAVGEFRLKLHGWTVERRFAVIRERVRESRDSVGAQVDRRAGLHLPDLRYQRSGRARGDLARLQPASRHGESDRRVEARPGGRRFLPEGVLRHRSRLPLGVAAVQSAGRVPTRGRFAGLSRARYDSHSGAHLRRHLGPCRPSIGCPPVAKLGWSENTHTLAG